MSKEIDRVLEESNVLLTTTKKFPTELAGVGITEEKVTGFETQIGTLRQKDTTFHDSKGQRSRRSHEQKVVIASAIKVVGRIKNAAEIAFVDDKTAIKAYRINVGLTTPVPRIISDLSYMKETTTAHKDLLLQSGVKQADLDELDAVIVSLTESENKQEDAKHTQKTHLVELNTLAKEIEKKMFIIRKAAAIAFQDKPEILQQFKPVTRRKSSKKTEPTTETTTETETGTN
ncbi:MAG: hypothetical protein WC602_01575 [archaeon]